MESHDRRSQERFSFDIQAKLSAEIKSEGKKITEETMATNISSGGAFVTTHLQIPLASKVYLEFLVDYEQLKMLRFILSLESLKSFTGKKIWIKATGIVIRIEEKGIGIIFDQDYQLSPMNGQNDK
jgi:hypothetical protein